MSITAHREGAVAPNVAIDPLPAGPARGPAPGPAPCPDPAPAAAASGLTARAVEHGSDAVMAGCSVLVTADRRADQLADLFGRRGARVHHAPVLTLAANDSDRGLLAATRSLIDDPPDLLVVTTAVGFRAWVETADSAGCAGELLAALADTRIIARGPKALGAVRSAGLTCDWSAPSETSAEVIAHLMSGDVSGLRAAVQHHAGGSDGMTEALTGAGAQVVDLLIYRLGPPADPDGVRAAARSVAQGRFDAICFTSAMAVNAWLRVLDEERTTAAFLRRACDGELLVAAVGPVCAAPLRALDLRPLVPDRSRLGALVRVVADHYENEPGIATAAGVLHLRAGAAVLDGRVLPVTATGLDVLHLLADSPGAVVSRADVLGVLPGNSRGEHAAEVAVSRLRESCGESRLISTVVKRGYRLNMG